MTALLSLAASVLLILAGVAPVVAVSQNLLEALHINYLLIPMSLLDNPLVLAADMLNAIVFVLFTVALAAWFYSLIGSFSVREHVVLSKIRKMKDHVIVVPYNGFSKLLLEELRRNRIAAVTITTDKRQLPHLYDAGELALHGSPKYAEAFETAQIDRARFVLACSDADMQNALIAITAKTANSGIGVIARVSSEEAMPKLSIAGAYKLIMPEIVAGESIGNEIAKRVS